MPHQQILQDPDVLELDPIAIVYQPTKSPHASEPLKQTRDRLLNKNNQAMTDPLLIPNR